MMEILAGKFQIIPHPYTYLPAKAIKENGVVRWFDVDTHKELPPFFGYGETAQVKVNEWYKSKRDE